MRRRHSEVDRDDSLVRTETETEGTNLRLRNATGCWQHQEVGGDEEVRQDPPLKPSEGMWPCQCLDFRLVPLELWESKSCCFKPPSLWSSLYGSPRKQIHQFRKKEGAPCGPVKLPKLFALHFGARLPKSDSVSYRPSFHVYISLRLVDRHRFLAAFRIHSPSLLHPDFFWENYTFLDVSSSPIQGCIRTLVSIRTPFKTNIKNYTLWLHWNQDDYNLG